MAGVLVARAVRANNPAAPAKKDTSVILLWLDGGAGHMDTYDMKPDAPDEYRGIWRPIKTNVPGVEISLDAVHAVRPSSTIRPDHHHDQKLVLEGVGLATHARHRAGYHRDPRSRPMGENLELHGRRADGTEFLALAPRVPVRTEVETFPLADANQALERLRGGLLRGAAVLLPDGGPNRGDRERPAARRK